MKKIHHLLLLVIMFSSCQKELDETPPDKSLIQRGETTKAGRVMACSICEYVFVFAGDGLYRVQTSNREVRLLSTNWSGTQAATTSGQHVFAVQGGVLWRYNVWTGDRTYLGDGWYGVESMTTTSDGNLYMVWGGSLWRTNPNNGVAVIVGADGWGGTRKMRGATNISSFRALQGGYVWLTNVTQPLSNTNPGHIFIGLDASKMQDIVGPHETKFIMNGKVDGNDWYYSPHQVNNPNFSNAIGWAATSSNIPTDGSYDHVWILTSTTLYKIDGVYGVFKNTIPFNGGYLITSALTP